MVHDSELPSRVWMPGADTTLVDLISATDYVLPAIEIVGSRIAGWNIRFTDTVADELKKALGL